FYNSAPLHQHLHSFPTRRSSDLTPQTDFGDKVKAHVRYYTSKGEQVPGVTTILSVLNKPALVSWANRMGLQGIDTHKYVDEAARSEEHTSELQSRGHLVCRLLLE